MMKKAKVQKRIGNEGKLLAMFDMMHDFGVDEHQLVKDKNVQHWFKKDNVILLQWYSDKREFGHFTFTYCQEKDLLRLATSWLQSSTEDQLTIWDSNGIERQLKVEKIKLV